jgi:hypothetical protein
VNELNSVKVLRVIITMMLFASRFYDT